MASGDSPADARLALVALVATLAIQIFTSFAASATPVLAPMLAGDLGIPPRWVGLFVGLVYVGAMAASLLAGEAIRRIGPIRASQVCVVLCTFGVAVIALLPNGAAGLLIAAALLIGIGYGPITPASSQVLARTAPPSRMALTFSIKQTGVPAGAALAGALLPGIALLAGWRVAFLCVGALGIAVALSAQPIRAALDADRRVVGRFSWRAVREPLATVWRHRALRELALVGLAYAATQTCLTSFLVVHLNATLDWSLVAAGLGLTVATLAGVVGRIGWGAIADRTRAPRAVLALIGVVAGTAAIGMALADRHWPVWVVVLLAAVLGATAIGWNGVQLAEVARKAPPGEAGAITGGAGVITFAGVVAGPPSFAVLAALTGSYRSGFLLVAVLSLGCGLLLHRHADGE